MLSRFFSASSDVLQRCLTELKICSCGVSLTLLRSRFAAPVSKNKEEIYWSVNVSPLITGIVRASVSKYRISEF